MHKIIWEFLVIKDQEVQFRRAYGGDGTWAKLFPKGKGYVGTELLADCDQPGRYVTIDTWNSEEDFVAFKVEFKNDYELMDKECESLTLDEKFIGVSNM